MALTVNDSIAVDYHGRGSFVVGYVQSSTVMIIYREKGQAVGTSIRGQLLKSAQSREARFALCFSERQIYR